MAASVMTERWAEPSRNATNEGSAVASLRSVTKKFGSQIALDRFSLQLYPGEVVALLGPNGAGKTTAVRLLLGLSQATTGEVEIFGGNPRDRASRLRLGAMLQVGRMPETLRVREHLQLFSSYYAHPRPLDELLAVAGLEGLQERLFGTLSGGQKQRMLFALALCGNPDLICLDEPTLGMDVEARRAMWEQVRRLAAMGKTVLLTTHYLEEADALASRIIVIQRGKVIAEGTPEELKTADGSRTIRCITTLEASFVSALPGVTDVEQDGGSMLVRTRTPEAVLRTMLQQDTALSGLEVRAAALEDAFLALTNQTPSHPIGGTMATAIALNVTRPSMPRIFFNEARFELLKLSRNRSYLFSMIGFPVVFYLLFGVTNKDAVFQGHTIARYLLAGYSCFGAMGSSLFGIGAGLAFERGHGWLEMKRASPMPAAAYLLAKLCVSITFAVGITILLMILGTALAGVHITAMEGLRLVLVIAGGVLPFASLGLVIGLLMPSNAAPGVINLIYLPLSFCGGLWMPIETLPHWLQLIAHGLPSYWFSRLALRTIGYFDGSPVVAWSVLGSYTVLFLLAAAFIFRRQEAQA
jgi:ABC-2 type transport system ATP-binding protein